MAAERTAGAPIAQVGAAGLPIKAWRFFRRWPIVPLFILTGLAVMAAFAPWLAPHDPYVGAVQERLLPPVWFAQGSATHLLGTDHTGRDILSRVIYGARVSMTVAAISITSGFLVGTTIGIVSGYVGGWWDEVIMRVVDIWYALPFLMLALVVVIIFGQSFTVVMTLLALLAWAGFVRVVRAHTLTLKNMDYIALARVAGAGGPRIIWKHILPSVIHTAVIIATLNVGGLIIAEATLSFLGAGIPAPTPAWGTMASEGRVYLGTAWWEAVFPGLAIFLVVMSLNFLGDWLRDKLDPRLRQLS